MRSRERKRFAFVLAVIVLAVVAVWSAGAIPVVSAQRPTPTHTPTTGPPPTPAPASPPSEPSRKRNEPLCIRGKVTIWGYRDEALATVSFTRPDGTVLETLSNVHGEYEFYAIDEQVGAINIEGDWPGHQMLTDDIVVRPHCNDTVYAWLGLYSGPTFPEMPVSVALSFTPETPKTGDTITLRAEVFNHMEVPITEVRLTDYMGQELAFVGAGGAGQAEHTDGLVTVKLDRLEPGASTWVTINAQIDPNLAADASFLNRVSVLYRESLAVQATAEINLGGEAQPAKEAAQPAAVTVTTSEESSEEHLPVTGVVMSAAGWMIRLLGMGLLALLVVAGWRRARRR
jgi:uncharacterized repeat protein (TIGR01451 family)